MKQPKQKTNPNDMTKDEYRAVVDADRRDSEEARKDAFFLTGEYGTYEIQPTADTKNVFPAIAQGLPKDWPLDTPKRNARGDRRDGKA